MATIRQAPKVGAEPDRALTAACERSLTGAESISQVLAARAQQVLSAIETGTVAPHHLPSPEAAWNPPDGGIERYAHQVNDLLAETRANLDTAAAGLQERQAIPDVLTRAFPVSQADQERDVGV